MARGIGRGKLRLAYSMARRRKPSCSCKNLAEISYRSRDIANFVPNFVAMATGVGRKNYDWQHLMAHPRYPPLIGAKVSQKSLTQAELLPILSQISLP